MGEQEKVTLTNYNLKETTLGHPDGGRKLHVARSTQNWETPKPGETVVSSPWGAQSRSVRIFRIEKIIQKQPKMELKLNLPCLGKTFCALHNHSRQGKSSGSAPG